MTEQELRNVKREAKIRILGVRPISVAPCTELGIARTGIRMNHDMAHLGKFPFYPIVYLLCHIVSLMQFHVSAATDFGFDKESGTDTPRTK